MLQEFDEFVNFCFEHGGTLRNHKQFGEMARELRAQIEAAEQSFAAERASAKTDGESNPTVLSGSH